MKKPIYMLAITLVIVGLVSAGVTAAFTNQAVSEKTSGVKNYSVVKMAEATLVEKISLPSEQKQAAILSNPQPLTMWAWMQKTEPAIAESHDGVVATAHRYRKDTVDVVGWAGSHFDAKRELYYDGNGPGGGGYFERRFNMWWPPNEAWSSVLYWLDSEGAHHPNIEFRGWNGTGRVFAGTMVGVDTAGGWDSGDPFVCSCDGGYYPNERGAETGFGGWTGSSWGFGESAQTRDMHSADIACDPTLPPEQCWQWGVCSYVMSNDGEEPIQDAPYFFFQFNDTGWATLSYYSLPNCAYTHTDIDVPAQMAYSVYDWNNLEDLQWQFFIRTDDWAEMQIYTGEEPYDDWESSGVVWSFESWELGIRNPCVAANDGNVVAITEVHNSSNPGDIDLVCWYTFDGNCSNFTTSVVAGTLDSEYSPEIEYIGGNSFVCAYYMNGAIYRVRSNDGGATWSDPIKVSGDDTVYDDHGSFCISNGGTKIMWTDMESDDSWVFNVARLETHVYISGGLYENIWEHGLTTCPAGDGAGVPMVVTVWDANGDPVQGIPAANFGFSVAAEGPLTWFKPYVPEAVWYATLGCTFVPIDAMTNANGEIQFNIIGDTSIIGDILITATVNGNPINDRDRLPCKSYDTDLDGDVDLGDFMTFGGQWGGTGWMCDFDWSGDVSLGDFMMFGAHWGHFA